MGCSSPLTNPSAPVLWSALCSVSLVGAVELICFGTKNDLIGEQAKKNLLFPLSKSTVCPVESHALPVSHLVSPSIFHPLPKFKTCQFSVLWYLFSFRFIDFILKRLFFLIGPFSLPWGHPDIRSCWGNLLGTLLQCGFYLRLFQILSIEISHYFFVGKI